MTVFKATRYGTASVLALAFFLMPAIGAVSSKAMVPLFLAAFVAVLAVQIFQGRQKSMPPPLLAIGLSVFVGWAALGLTWAPIPLPAGFGVLSLAGMVTAGMVFLWLIPIEDGGERRRVENWYLAGYAAANLIFAFEAISGNWISRRVRGLEWRDIISIDAEAGTIDVALSDDELAERRKKWTPRQHDYQSGALWKYAQTVGPAFKGAVTHPGARAETHIYADI